MPRAAALVVLLASYGCADPLSDQPCGPRYLDGWCAAGWRCDAGACVPDVQVCGPIFPAGQCPGGRVCYGGVCRAPDDPSLCSAANHVGLCPELWQVCQAGACHAIDSEPPCAPGNPGGACPGGFCCSSGLCLPCPCGACSPDCTSGWCPEQEVCDGSSCGPAAPDDACGAGGCHGRCPTGQRCFSPPDGGDCRCVPALPDGCSAVNPDGRCPATLVCIAGDCIEIPARLRCGQRCPDGLCEAGHCVPFASSCVCDTATDGACSADNPGGWCEHGLVCDPPPGCAPPDCCVLPDCSARYPWGRCPAGERCQDGDCHTDPSGDRCGLGNVDGLCADSCDTGSCSEAVCVEGHCEPALCDSDHPRGLCRGFCLVCQGGQCEWPPCGPAFPCGVCQVCQVCDDNSDHASFGQCIPASCSLSCPDGACHDPREVCSGRVLGVCAIPACSREYPYGTCSSAAFECDTDPGGCPGLLEGACPDEDGCEWDSGLGVCVRKSYGGCILAPCEAPGNNTGYGSCESTDCAVFATSTACLSGPHCSWGLCRGIGLCGLYEDVVDCLEQAACWWEELCGDSRSCRFNLAVRANECYEPPCSMADPDGPCPEPWQTCFQGSCLPRCDAGEVYCDHLAQRCAQSLGVCLPQPCSDRFIRGSCPTVADICLCRRGVDCAAYDPYGASTDGHAWFECRRPPCTFEQCLGADGCTEYSGDQDACTERPGCSWFDYWFGVCDSESCQTAGDMFDCLASPECAWGRCAGHAPCAMHVDAATCAADGCSWFAGCFDRRVCAAGTCVVPPCSNWAPWGRCPPRHTCQRGAVSWACQFMPIACDNEHPQGDCPLGQRCRDDDGTSELDLACRVATCDLLPAEDLCPAPCPAYQRCDSDRDSPTCGYCTCDGTCDQDLPCAEGWVRDCDEPLACELLTADACSDRVGCAWHREFQSCLTVSCGYGQCISTCDTTCGNQCQEVYWRCDDDPWSPTCGQCLWTTSCTEGGASPGPGWVCDPSTGRWVWMD